uniref:Protein kinase domain-containing protein n=1 Tax=Araucaria cunninghamii TaxID=56994 RepID=A0A0D6QVM7_ARACU
MEKFAVKLIIVVFAILIRGLVHGDLEGDKRALLALQTAVGGRMVWNASGSACDWEGIKCSKSRVVLVTLPGAALSGNIPSDTLGNLTGLRILRLRFNALQGSIPADLSNCRELRTLYLQDNQFSGPFTANFSAWPNLTRLNLAGNKFSGSVPDSLSKLKRLGSLFLENNSFTGPLPALDLPALKQFNVSGNNLTGAIPDMLKSFPANSFAGTGLCNSPLQPCIIHNNNNNNTVNNNTSINNGGKGKSHRVVIIIAIVVGCVVLVGLVFGISVVFCRRKRTGDETSGKKAGDGEKQCGQEVDDSFTKEEYSLTVQEPEKINKNLVFFPNQKQQFSLEDLLRASAELLGKGTVGTAYKAILETGMFVVVKRMKDIVIGPRDFAHQIHTVGKMRHKNLVAPMAYYYSSEEKLIVYDYMRMGSLSACLHGNRGAGRAPLGWDTRVHIALGAAMGIEYLHKQGKKNQSWKHKIFQYTSHRQLRCLCFRFWLSSDSECSNIWEKKCWI